MNIVPRNVPVVLMGNQSQPHDRNCCNGAQIDEQRKRWRRNFVEKPLCLGHASQRSALQGVARGKTTGHVRVMLEGRDSHHLLSVRYPKRAIPFLIEHRSRLARPWQQPAHHHLTRVVAAARKLVTLRRHYSKAGGLLLGLSLIVWKRHPLPNDRPANLLFVHSRVSV